MSSLRLSAVLSFLALSTAAQADVVLASVFTDHAVLQRDKPLPIFGRADVGERVTVSFADQTIGTVADKSGRWIVYLAPLVASSEPAELVVVGNNTVRLADILVGDVWLCSGQSNMEWPVERSLNAAEETATADLPLIRHIKFQRTVADAPAATVANDGAGWRVCTPQTANWFTAVGFFFARDLQARVAVPIGLINCTYGGTPIESWLSPAALASDPAFEVVSRRWESALSVYPERKAAYEAALQAWKGDKFVAEAKGQTFTVPAPREPVGQGHPFTPTSLFNGMVHPLVPVALRGVLWYQGESNTALPEEYRGLFTALITHWRQHLGQGELPFFWVQLANYHGGNPTDIGWARLREAQAHALNLPATGQAVAIDIGDADDIHPLNKKEVGRRLALLARAKVFGSHVDFSGPVFKNAVREGQAMRVTFDHAGNGLIARDKPPQSFQIAGVDRKFFPAIARIEGDTVIVSAAEVAEPVAVRYAFFNAPEANLYNGAGLPMAPFRSDDW